MNVGGQVQFCRGKVLLFGFNYIQWPFVCLKITLTFNNKLDGNVAWLDGNWKNDISWEVENLEKYIKVERAS